MPANDMCRTTLSGCSLRPAWITFNAASLFFCVQIEIGKSAVADDVLRLLFDGRLKVCFGLSGALLTELRSIPSARELRHWPDLSSRRLQKSHRSIRLLGAHHLRSPERPSAALQMARPLPRSATPQCSDHICARRRAPRREFDRLCRRCRRCA